MLIFVKLTTWIGCLLPGWWKMLLTCLPKEFIYILDRERCQVVIIHEAQNALLELVKVESNLFSFI
jgi:hypothetical protein